MKLLGDIIYRLSRSWDGRTGILLQFLFVFAIGCILLLAVGFPWKWAILLAFFMAYMEDRLNDLAPKPQYKLSPYRVIISPKWDLILTDYRVAKDPGDYQRFKDWCGKPFPIDSFCVLRDDKDGMLLFREKNLAFGTRCDWSEELKKKEKDQSGIPIIDPPGPREFPYIDFFLKLTVWEFSLVIDMGISVDIDWWESVSGNCPKPLKAETNRWGRVDVVLAQLPLQEFDLYWDLIDNSSVLTRGYYAKQRQKNSIRFSKSVEESRKKHGWEDVKGDEYDEFGRKDWIEISHNYFRVIHCSVK